MSLVPSFVWRRAALFCCSFRRDGDRDGDRGRVRSVGHRYDVFFGTVVRDSASSSSVVVEAFDFEEAALDFSVEELDPTMPGGVRVVDLKPDGQSIAVTDENKYVRSTGRWMGGWVDGWTDGRMDGQTLQKCGQQARCRRRHCRWILHVVHSQCIRK